MEVGEIGVSGVNAHYHVKVSSQWLENATLRSQLTGVNSAEANAGSGGSVKTTLIVAQVTWITYKQEEKY